MRLIVGALPGLLEEGVQLYLVDGRRDSGGADQQVDMTRQEVADADVLVEATERGVIPNDWTICHTREEIDEHMRDIIDDPEDYQPTESVESALSNMLGWKELERYDADAEALGMRNRSIYWDVCKKLKAMRKEAGVSLDEMARRTGLSATALWRAENDLHRMGLLDLLPDYCAALGKTFEITIRDADQK